MGGQGHAHPTGLSWEHDPPQKREGWGAELGQEKAPALNRPGLRQPAWGWKGDPSPSSPPQAVLARSQSFQGREAPAVSPPSHQWGPHPDVSGVLAWTSAASLPGH